VGGTGLGKEIGMGGAWRIGGGVFDFGPRTGTRPGGKKDSFRTVSGEKPL